MMKMEPHYNLRYCSEEIVITQSERAKHGYKKLEDHKVDCAKVKNVVSVLNRIATQLPDDVISDKGENMSDIIRRLHIQFGRIPTETEALLELMRIRAMKEALK
jgi:CRISPR/Cas system type I-B associated protein Csh2 (Cas7 group RAMP superfamily)